MPTLAQYTTETQRILHDPNGEAYSTSDLTAYINEARGQLALESESVRFLWGTQGWTITGTTTATSTTITALSSTFGLVKGQFLVGTGIASAATISSVNTGASTLVMSAPATASGTITITVIPSNLTVVNQEQYPYPPVGTGLALPLGIDGVFQVKSITSNWGAGTNSNQYTLLQLEFTRFQAFLRQRGPNDIGQPEVWCNYNGVAYLRKIPSQILGMQWDCICTVSQLSGATTDVDAILYPWSNCVKYLAAYLALINAQRYEDATQMKKLYTEFAQRAQAFRQRTMVSNVYLSY